MTLYDIDAATSYIRDSARRRGIDPDTAVRVARSEGLAPNTYQSNVRKNGVRETSYGPFQLLVGDGKTFPTGMGNAFVAQTGLDPRDPSTVNAQIDFALDHAAKNGWGAWYGARNSGISNRQGIGSDAAAAARSAPSGGVGTDTLAGGGGSDTLLSTNAGSLGGLGGMPAEDRSFLASDEFGSILRAAGQSLLTSPAATPFANFGTALDSDQRRREVQNDRDLARQEKLNDRNATQAVLRQAGLSDDQAKAYASNPTAARIALDLHQQQADRESYGKFAATLRSPATAAPVADTSVEAAPLAPLTAPSRGSALLAPASLTDAVPAASTSPAATPTAAGAARPTEGNLTVATFQRLQAESDRLNGVAAQATTDDERQAAAAAIRANDAKLAYAQKALDRMNDAPPGYQRSADGSRLEAIPGGPADAAVIAANRKDAAPADVQEYQYYRDQERAAGRTPLSFLDYQNSGRKAGATTISTGGGENKQVFDAMADSYGTARSAVSGLNSIRDARAAIDAGGIFGAGADLRLGLQKVGAYLGVTDPSKIENTETFRSAIAPSVAALMKQTVGSANISNSDREFAEKAAGGSIALEPTTIKRLLGIMERASTEAVKGHQSRLDKVYPAGGGFERERALFGVDLPDMSGAAPPPTVAPSAATLPAQGSGYRQGSPNRSGTSSGGVTWRIK